MGAYLSKPETSKEVEQGSGQNYEYATAAMQGWRRTMEDAHAMVPNLQNNPDNAFFGVFDGHGGPEVARFCAKYMPKEMQQLEAFKNGDIKGALIEVFHKMDEMLTQQKYYNEIEEMRPKDNSGDEYESGDSKDDDGDMGLGGFLRRFLQRTTGAPSTPDSNSYQDQNKQNNPNTSQSQSSNEQKQQQSSIQNSNSSSNSFNNNIAAASDSQATPQAQEAQPSHMEAQASPLDQSGGQSETDKLQQQDMHITNTSSNDVKPGEDENKDVDMTESSPEGQEDQKSHESQDKSQQSEKSSMTSSLPGPVAGTFQVAQSAINNGMQLVDRTVANFEPHVISGCTAIVAFMQGDTLFVANAGDSRGVICRNGQATALSDDHKPYADAEKERITNAGGFLSEIGGVFRVNGNLNLSRAIGDLRYKQNNKLAPKNQIITAEPDVKEIKLQSNDEFIILACDGVWDVMSNQEVCNFIRHRLRLGSEYNLKRIVCELLDNCLARDPKLTRGLGGDNMTAILIQLKQ